MKNFELLTPASDFALPLIGGKAHGILKLIKLKKRTPKSIVLFSSWFEQLLHSPEVKTFYENFLASCRKSDFELIQKSIQTLQDNIRTLPKHYPDDFLSYLQNHFKNKVAIRSSIIVEDSVKSSFAGLFSSFFKRTTDQAGIEVIKEVLKNCFNERIILYALEKGISIDQIIPAILIQEEIDCQYSGVAFSTNPMGKNDDEIYLSFKEGHGENLMSGDHNGRSYIFSKNLLRSKNYQEIDQLNESSSFKKHLLELLEFLIKEEQAQMHPIDVEWGIDQGGLVYFQMRPITTLGPIKKKKIRWSRMITEERYPEVLSPLGWSILHGVFHVNLKTLKNRFGLIASSTDEVAKVIGHYVYANDSFFNFPENININITHQLKSMPRIIIHFFIWLISFPLFLFKKSYFNLKMQIQSCLFQAFIFPHAKDIIKKWDSSLGTNISSFDQHSNEDLRNTKDSDLFLYRNKLENIAFNYMEPDLAIYIIKMACVWMINQLSPFLFPDKEKSFLLIQVTQGLESNRTLEMNKQLEDLSLVLAKNQKIRSLLEHDQFNEVLMAFNSEEKKAFDHFMKLNGHLTTSWDIREPVWEEAPDKVLKLLRPLLDSDTSLTNLMKNKNQQFLQFRKELEAIIKDPREKSFLSNLISILRELMRIDEEHHFYCSRVFKSVRRFYEEVASRLIKRGLLKEIDDIFFLTETEIKNLFYQDFSFSLAFKTQRQRDEFNRARPLTPPISYLGDFVEREEMSISSENKNQLKGEGASQGEFTGIIRLIENEDDFKNLKNNEIILTQSPNPALTPLYGKAGGLIATTGSLLSHGLVSAREYNLPAVVGIPMITKILKTGQRVYINGRTGEIRIEDH